MTESCRYFIDLSKLNGEKEKVQDCVIAAVSQPNQEVRDNKIFFSCKEGSLAYLQFMLSEIWANIDISPVQE